MCRPSKIFFLRRFFSGLAPEIPLNDLTASQRAAAFARLRAVLAAEEDGVSRGARLASSISTSPAHFRKLLEAWRKDRRLAVLIPAGWVGAAPSRNGLPDVEMLRRAIADIVRRHPDAATPILLKIIGAELRPCPSPKTLRKFIGEERRRGKTTAIFGSRIAIDHVAAGITSREPDVIVALVLDEATGLVLGGAAGDAVDVARLNRRALVRAGAFLVSAGVDPTNYPFPFPALACLTLSDPEAGELVLNRAVRFPGSVAVHADGPRRYGKQIQAIIGARLGPIRFKPRATQRAMAEECRERRGFADAVLQNEIACHNRALLSGRTLGEVVLGRPGRGKSALTLVREIERILSLEPDGDRTH